MAIYQFRNTVDEVESQSGTDMFSIVSIKPGHYRVMEHAQLNESEILERELNESAILERNLNESGETAGDMAQHQF